MTSSSGTVKTWRIHRMGLVNKTMQLDDVPVREPGPGQVLIRVAACALNPVDWKLPMIKPLALIYKRPRTLAADVSGIVEAFGSGCETSNLKKGDRVMGHVVAKGAIRSGEGTLTQRLVLPIDMVQAIPDELSFEKAAGIPLVGLTALALARFAEPGHRVLIPGGSTGVGLLLIKILKEVRKVDFVAATASGSKVDVVKERGADDVVDYRATNSVEELTKRYKDAPFDLILDCVGDIDIHEGCAAFLTQTGTNYNVGASTISPDTGLDFSFIFRRLRATLFPVFLGGVPRKVREVVLEGHRMPQLGEIVRTVDLDPLTDSTFTFEEAPKAFERIMSGRALGKVVVVVDPSLK